MERELLFGLMAEALVRLTADKWEFPQPARTAAIGSVEPVRAKAGDAGHGQLLTAFTHGGYVLAELGVTEITVDAGRGSNWRYLVNGNEVAKFVAQNLRSGESPFPEFEAVAHAWIMCAEHFGMISSRRNLFIPHDDMVPCLDSMTRNGYAEKYGNQFLWTDAVGKAMQEAYLWSDDNLSLAEIEERKVDADLQEAIKTMPEIVRLAALRNDALAVQFALCNSWSDGQWKAPPEGAKLSLFGGIGRAQRFIELIVNSKKLSKIN